MTPGAAPYATPRGDVLLLPARPLDVRHRVWRDDASAGINAQHVGRDPVRTAWFPRGCIRGPRALRARSACLSSGDLRDIGDGFERRPDSCAVIVGVFREVQARRA